MTAQRGLAVPNSLRACIVSCTTPSSALTFFWEGSPTKVEDRKKGYPYSNLSTGGPRYTSNCEHLTIGAASVLMGPSGSSKGDQPFPFCGPFL